MIYLFLRIALFGAIVYAIVTYIPMLAPFRQVIIVLAFVLLLIYLMGVFGVVDLPIPRMR
jgi:hypothetical protein